MDKKIYAELLDLVDIHKNCISDGEEIFCFELIKEIVDGKIVKEEISKSKKVMAQKQLSESWEWLESLGVTIKYKNELENVINSI